MIGTLYLVGVGTGDPELLTIKAVRILKETPVISFGQKPNTSSRALGIAKNFLSKDAILLPINIPMEIKREPAKKAYDEAAKKIEQHLKEGQNVAYICEGDPLFYASAMYLIERLKSKIKIEVIPGITSLQAASSALVQPLVSRNEILKILPATLDDERLLVELKNAQAVALIKIGRHFARIKNLLKKSGHIEGAKIVINASCENQQIINVGDYDKDELPYFAIIISHKGGEVWSE